MAEKAAPLLGCTVLFRCAIDDDGADSGMIEAILPPEISAGKLLLPRSIFSAAFNGYLSETPRRKGEQMAADNEKMAVLYAGAL